MWCRVAMCAVAMQKELNKFAYRGLSLIKGSFYADTQKVKNRPEFYKKFMPLKGILLIFAGLCLVQGTILTAQESAAPATNAATAVEVVADDSVPLLLEGIWENSNRYVVFDTDYIASDNRAIPNIVLKTFYQWYDDRAAESPEYSAKNKRDRNNTTPANPERILLHFTPLTDELFTPEYKINVTQEDGDILTADGECSGAWDMQITYSSHKLGGKNTYHVPIAVIGNKLYLKFRVKAENSDSVDVSTVLDGSINDVASKEAGYWLDAGNANGILVSPPVSSEELLSYLVTDSAVYPVRYWETDMEYDANARARLDDGGNSSYVPKHLLVGGLVYTCTLGRRTQIRNVQKRDKLPEPYSMNSVLVEKHAVTEEDKPISYRVRTSTILVFGEPYLTLTDGTRTLEEIVQAANSRKKPPRKPLFPPHGVLDFDWSIIEDPPKDYNRRMLDLGK